MSEETNYVDLDTLVEDAPAGVDVDARNDVFVPLYPGRYRMVADFTEEDAGKRWVRGTRKDPDSESLATKLTLKPVANVPMGNAQPAPESFWANKRITGVYVSTQAYTKGASAGTSTITDILKSMGFSKDELRGLSHKEYATLLTQGVLEQREFEVITDWEGSAKTSKVGDNGKAVYVRPDEFNKFSKFPLTGTDEESGLELRSALVEGFDYRDPESGTTEKVDVQAQARYVRAVIAR